MALFLQLATYSAQGSQAIAQDGFVARRSAIQEMLSSAGGSVVGYYAVTNGDWHVAAIVELPDSATHADLGRIEVMQIATGGVERLSLLPLASPEDFDSASRLAEEAYQSPGEH